MEKRERLSEQIVLRVTPSEKREIAEFVKNYNETTSTFIRNAIINYINYLKIYHPNDNSVE